MIHICHFVPSSFSLHYIKYVVLWVVRFCKSFFTTMVVIQYYIYVELNVSLYNEKVNNMHIFWLCIDKKTACHFISYQLWSAGRRRRHFFSCAFLIYIFFCSGDGCALFTNIFVSSLDIYPLLVYLNLKLCGCSLDIYNSVHTRKYRCA